MKNLKWKIIKKYKFSFNLADLKYNKNERTTNNIN